MSEVMNVGVMNVGQSNSAQSSTCISAVCSALPLIRIEGKLCELYPPGALHCDCMSTEGTGTSNR